MFNLYGDEKPDSGNAHDRLASGASRLPNCPAIIQKRNSRGISADSCRDVTNKNIQNQSPKVKHFLKKIQKFRPNLKSKSGLKISRLYCNSIEREPILLVFPHDRN